MNDVRFTFIIPLRRTRLEWFRETLVSLAAMNYANWEAIFVRDPADPAPGEYIRQALDSAFPKDGRIHFRELPAHGNGGRAINAGLRFAGGDYCIFLPEHDLISPDVLTRLSERIVSSLTEGVNSLDDLTRAASGNLLRQWKKTGPDIVYTDHDELIGGTRMNPHFKCGWNRMLLLQTDYIGTAVAFSMGFLRQAGAFDETLSCGEVYELILRAALSDRQVKAAHVPGLLFHTRIDELPAGVYRTVVRDRYDTYFEAASAALRRSSARLSLSRDREMRCWPAAGKGYDWKLHKKEFMILRDPTVRVNLRRAIPRLFGYLREPDVGAVGVLFTGPGGLVDNAGFIYDSDGGIYPAARGQNPDSGGYEMRLRLTQEVSAVDTAFCMVDMAAYRKVRGFRADLTGRDRMLDFFLRMHAAGYRVLFTPSVRARNTAPVPLSSERSHTRLMEMYGPRGTSMHISLAGGDPYYNPNLPCGMENYTLDTI